MPGGPQRDPGLEALLGLGRPVAGSTLTCEHRRGQHPTEEQQCHAQGQTARHPGRGASAASERQARGLSCSNFRAEGTRHQRAGEGFHQCKLCPPGTPCPPPTHEHTHTHTQPSSELTASLNPGAAPPSERERGNRSFPLSSFSLSVSLSHTHTYAHTHGCTWATERDSQTSTCKRLTQGD